ncbi:MAG: Bax inhibitor-1/YccA family protein [Ktedonobacteraceae bacterium]|nr:Bax inhibitor-1/YccA family protein [Ktedonobacteraceae bacterium]MBO0793608.1 Bax inhibitor-1/YccA family protein [Ktedonobacteraceae bacterium]
MSQVYLWMTGGLLVTGAVAVFTTQTPALLQLIYGTPFVFFALLLLEIGLVWGISASIRRIAPSTATALFVLYSAINGLTLSVFFLVYTSQSIASTFFIAGGMFALMSLYGFTTKRDLSTIGNMAMMALVGIILASLVNLFLHSTGLYWIITYLGVLIFVGLTAWDTQKIKRMIGATNPADMDTTQRIVIIGALELYLDFVNLFLFLLRIFGRRR